MIFRYAIAAVASTVLLAGCDGQPSKLKTDQEIIAELERDGPPDFQAAKLAYANPLQGIDQKVRQERLKALLSDFNITQDEFSNSW
jgi:hypothetical protein